MTQWIVLITSLPTENAAVRMRTWRALKASGAAVLRDGVYLLPDVATCREGFDGLAADMMAAGGTALVMGVVPPEGVDFEALFDRTEAYQALSQQIAHTLATLSTDTASDHTKLVRKLRKTFLGVEAVDFFPGEVRVQVERQLAELELACVHALSPDEPRAQDGDICALKRDDYQGRIWVTRERPWADRLASAWLIQRFIDPKARLRWLRDPSGRPANSLGFDFDGAEFTHVGHRVTFEVLIASFGLNAPGLPRLAALVHCLDVGGLQPAEAIGVKVVLKGLQLRLIDVSVLQAAANEVFDGLLAQFANEAVAL